MESDSRAFQTGHMASRGMDFKIFDMDCAEEVAILKREIGPMVGGDDRLAFDILHRKMTVNAATNVEVDTIVAAIKRTGMRVQPWSESPSESVETALWRRYGRNALTVSSGLLLVAGFLTHLAISGGLSAALGSSHDVPVAARIVYSFAILAGGWFVLPKAWFAARRLRPDMNLLMAVAVIGAAAIGEWFEAATVSFLFALSLALESWSVGRARRAIAALIDLAPTTVRVLRVEGGDREVLAQDVAVGSRFLVKPGERIPLDGIVRHGSSEVNQAPITGESLRISKRLDDFVFAGTINGDGALEVESTKPAGDTTLAHIIKLVGEAQARRGPSQQWVERFAAIYTPCVMALAIGLFLVPTLFLGGEWSVWLYRSLVLLVIACPCALVISTPVTIVAAMASSARNGVLVKGGIHIESPAQLKAIAFDKTGTLTEGKPGVVEVVPLSGHDERELLERAAALESRSEHPLAQAIVRFARARGVEYHPADNFQVIQGKGATARFDGCEYWLGSHRYLEERGQETPEVHDRLEAMSRAGRTVVVIGKQEHVCGFIGLADAVRQDSRRCVEELRGCGIAHVVMLTGDNRGTADTIAREIGVDEVHADLLPADKLTVVESLVLKYGSIAMVGDGVNDAPALARATLGIAMGAAGSDAAIETADIALMSDDLTKLPWLIRHSRRTIEIIRQNIAFALSIKCIFMLLTVFGYASLWAAIAADTGASLLVIFNGLRLLKAQSGLRVTAVRPIDDASSI